MLWVDSAGRQGPPAHHYRLHGVTVVAVSLIVWLASCRREAYPGRRLRPCTLRRQSRSWRAGLPAEEDRPRRTGETRGDATSWRRGRTRARRGLRPPKARPGPPAFELIECLPGLQLAVAGGGPAQRIECLPAAAVGRWRAVCCVPCAASGGVGARAAHARVQAQARLLHARTRGLRACCPAVNQV